jgi:hypothetical protein
MLWNACATMKPIHHVVPPRKIPFPINYLISTGPQPITGPVPAPDLSTAARRGEYLVAIGAFEGCHTPRKKGKTVPGLEFGGGSSFKGPWGEVASANITPDATGMSYYDETLFIQAMRTGYVKARELKSIMAWWDYRGLTDGDLKDIFVYLSTLKPVRHRGGQYGGGNAVQTLWAPPRLGESKLMSGSFRSFQRRTWFGQISSLFDECLSGMQRLPKKRSSHRIVLTWTYGRPTGHRASGSHSTGLIPIRWLTADRIRCLLSSLYN